MPAVVDYQLSDAIATVTIDDGKVNVMSLATQRQIHAALDRAADDRAVVVLAGRPEVFSAGFDLPTLQSGGQAAVDMVQGGFELAARLLSFPLPVVIACTGHAIAMGVFLVLSGDYRVGEAGPFSLRANEVAIGLTMPRAATEILRQRLTPSAFNRAVTIAQPFTPADAVEAGFLDRVVDSGEALAAAHAAAATLTRLDLGAHDATKLRARESTLEAIRSGIERDRAELVTR